LPDKLQQKNTLQKTPKPTHQIVKKLNFWLKDLQALEGCSSASGGGQTSIMPVNE
jgi:hypothetical protein